MTMLATCLENILVVQARILKENDKAIYIPCMAHSLNLWESRQQNHVSNARCIHFRIC